MSQMRRILVLCFVASVLAVSFAAASVQSTTPAVVAVPPPADLQAGQTTSNTDILAFDERQCITLEKLLPVNATQDGTVPFPLVNFPIAAGTEVSCHFLHFDPETTASANGSVTFDADILGVIVSDPDLDASDSVCGVSGTIYPTGVGARGAEQPGDVVNIDLGTRTVRVDWTASDPGDQIRVITRCDQSGIPEIEAKLDQLEPQVLDNQAALEAKLDALQGQVEEIHQILSVLREEIARIEAKLDVLR